MKVTLNKKVFALDEKKLIKQFKSEWATPTVGDIETVLGVVSVCLNIHSPKLVAVREIELTKNHFEPTYWVSVVVKGFDENFNELYVEIGFDYKQAVLSCSGDRIDNFTQIYKKV